MSDTERTSEAKASTAPPYRFWPALAGEFAGTFLLVFFGVGAVNAAVVSGAQVGLWQVAAVWAVGVALGIYASASLSGGHINPAITAVAAVYDRFPLSRVGPYWLAQVAGAAAASLVLYALFAEAIIEFERLRGLLRGGPGSERCEVHPLSPQLDLSNTRLTHGYRLLRERQFAQVRPALATATEL